MLMIWVNLSAIVNRMVGMAEIRMYRDFPEQRNQRVALCLSGGGSRAFAAGLGQLRALHALGLLKRIDYLSAVSGGAWLSVLISCLTGELDTLLGHPQSLSTICKEDLFFAPSADYLGRLVTGSLVRQDLSLPRSLMDHERWIALIKEQFLSHYGLANTGWGGAYIEPPRREDWPYLVVSGGLIWPNLPWRYSKIQLMQWTLDYGGIYTHHHVDDHDFGGGFCSLNGLNSQIIEREGDRAEVLEMGGFSLAEMMGCSSAFYAKSFDHSFLLRSYSPFLNYWPPFSEDAGGLYSVGDGGFVDNLGLIPMLQRRLEKIIVCVNTATPFRHPRFDADRGWLGVDDALPRLFGEPYGEENSLDAQVFSNTAWSDWLHQAKSCGADGMVFSQTLEVLRNEWFSIEPYEVEIVWVYNSLPKAWYAALPQFLRDDLATPHFKGFPHYPTLGENFHWYKESSWKSLGMLDLSQVNLLSLMTEWVMHRHQSQWSAWF